MATSAQSCIILQDCLLQITTAYAAFVDGASNQCCCASIVVCANRFGPVSPHAQLGFPYKYVFLRARMSQIFHCSTDASEGGSTAGFSTDLLLQSPNQSCGSSRKQHRIRTWRRSNLLSLHEKMACVVASLQIATSHAQMVRVPGS